MSIRPQKRELTFFSLQQLTTLLVAVAVHGYVAVQPVVSGANLQYVSASTPLWQARHRRVLSVQPPQITGGLVVEVHDLPAASL
jgi:hypothetical protein